MSISESIRPLAGDGLRVADIARHLGIRYQHAYNVLKRSNMLPPPRVVKHGARKRSAKAATPSKPPLLVEALERGGFELSARWILSDAGELVTDRPLPKAAGVYAFAREGTVLYVGVGRRAGRAHIGITSRAHAPKSQSVRPGGLSG